MFIRKVHDLGRVADGRPAPPLLLMSGHGEQRGAREVLGEPGVRGLLAKPFSVERLLTRLGACLPGVIRPVA
jgi:DNA-binding response OmpR family regulator